MTPTNRPAPAKAQRITKPKRRVKARKMWSDEAMRDTKYIPLFSVRSEAANASGMNPYDQPEPFFVLPADEASVERMVERVAKRISPDLGYIQVWSDQGLEWNHADTITIARAALAALGLTRNPNAKRNEHSTDLRN